MYNCSILLLAPKRQSPRSVSIIDNECRLVNEKLRRLAAVLPDVASLSPLDYDTSKRADPEILQKLVSQAKNLRVSDSVCVCVCVCVCAACTCSDNVSFIYTRSLCMNSLFIIILGVHIYVCSARSVSR